MRLRVHRYLMYTDLTFGGSMDFMVYCYRCCGYLAKRSIYLQCADACCEAGIEATAINATTATIANNTRDLCIFISRFLVYKCL
jgi:hypothetical protein